MRSQLFWQKFSDIVVNQLVRPIKGTPFLIITDTENDINVALSCLTAGLRNGADTQLIIKDRLSKGTASKPGPILSEAILASKYILEFCGGIVRAPATIKARSKGTMVLSTYLKGIEDYALRAILDVKHPTMIKNAERVGELWQSAESGRVTSPQGTNISFNFGNRKSIIGDGALSEEGEVDFFPGAQVSIAPLEETINGKIVVDASDGVQGLIHNPYTLIIEKGIIVDFEGGKEADIMKKWLESREDEKIFHLCHYSLGLNPQARITGNLIEDERVLAAVDFGFGYQDPKFGGTVGLSPYHMDVMLENPTTYVDGKKISGNGQLNPEMGFEDATL